MINQIKQLIYKNKFATSLLTPCYRMWSRLHFRDSMDYWQKRYITGGNSGDGSYGRLAEFKAQVLNAFVRQQGIQHVVELGCGDGNQLSLAEYPAYTGLDISENAIARCRTAFAHKPSYQFSLSHEYHPRPEIHDLALSLDVIFHLVEEDVFEAYMRQLFSIASRYVVIYSSNKDEKAIAAHVRHRKFTDWIDKNAPAWRLAEHIPNAYPFDPALPHCTSFADFYIYKKYE